MALRMFKLKILKVVKDFLLFSRLLQILTPFNKLFLFIYNFNSLTSWVHKNKNEKYLINDFYRPIRNYFDREKSYQALVEHLGFDKKEFIYLEFGVAGGYSFNWWMEHCKNPDSRFFGFDTFEGLPEAWGMFEKGEMHANVPQLPDSRGRYIKGIFQDTLTDFLESNRDLLKSSKPRVIHLDPDLFSATIFVLSQMYCYLRKGDIIMFDEFNVCNHEYQAYRIFTECFYVKLRPISAQNNYLHAAFIVE